MLPLKVYLVVDGKMGVSAEKLIAPFERRDSFQHTSQHRRSIMAQLRLQVQRGGSFPRPVAEGQRNVIAKDHFLVVVGKLQVLLQPMELVCRELSRLPIGLPPIEMHIVEADIMDIAPVETIVGWSEALFPLAAIEVAPILVMIADDGEDRGTR